ncbi:SOS response-associated peptidase [Rhodospirillaceae bacterium SYSU D60014]|uniref:SOS response-associated peptidase n=1 Tax=Virgifigura deserti TaxID=2268457 RepID=UPI000E67555C
MCGRYTNALTWREIVRLYRITEPSAANAPNLEPRYNLAPTQSAPVVRHNPETGGRSLDMLRWGLVPHWAKDMSIGNKLINARAEGIDTKPSFRSAFAKRRCLVPAGGFYEWKKEGTKKQPYAIALKSGEPMSFAGLWENWQDPDSGEWIRTFTIVTTEANEFLAPLHNRMPVILHPTAHSLWLGETPAKPDTLKALLKLYPADEMQAWPVSTRVNNVRNEQADLWDRLDPVNPA